MKLILGILLLMPALSSAQMDSASRDLLIEKLNKVNLTLAPSDSSKVSVTLRLADLLAERARLAAMKDLESGCTSCTAGTSDREKAVRLYKDVIDRVPLASRGKVLIQLGHLSELTGKEKEAIGFYEKVKAESQDDSSRAESALSLAEMFYKKAQYSRARELYREVLAVSVASSRGLAAYRAAWCSFNMGELERATQEMFTILDTPQLLTRNGVSSSQVDTQFQEEVSRDLATFLAKKKVEIKEVTRLFEASPEVTRVANVTLLANEAERIGHRQEALMVWNFVYSHQSSPSDRLEVLVHRAPLELEVGQRAAVMTDLEAMTQLWKELKGCGKADCTEVTKLWRQFIVNWNQTEKKAPTSELSKAYSLYLEVFSNDVEMNLWAAEVAKTQKDYPLAFSRLGQAAGLQELSKKMDAFESSLLASIEVGEASGDAGLLLKAQDQYLARSVKGSKKFEIQYQKAHRLYETNKYAEASQEMKTLALSQGGTPQLRKQAADLALDSLAILKDDAKIIEWSREFALHDKNNAADFQAVAQKAILAQSAALSSERPADALAILGQFDSAKASQSDRIIYLKNKIILAERQGQYLAARNAIDELLLMKDLKTEDREFALVRKAWIAELQLDFATAFKVTQQLNLKDQKPEERALQLAIYSDLAGQNSSPLYQQYLKTSRDELGQQAVASELVRRSQDPMKEIELQRSILEKSPDLLARLYTEAYSKTASEKILQKAIAENKIQKTDWGRLLARTQLLKDYDSMRVKIASSSLVATNQKLLGKSIKDRAALLTQGEALANKAIQMGDWTSQLVTIDLVAKESARFYQELMSLPLPEGLKPEEEQEYMQILGQQASPFQAKAEQAQAKVKEFWARSSWKADLERSVKNGSEFRTLMGRELAALKVVASSDDQKYLESLEAQNVDTLTLPDLKQIEAAKEKVRTSPKDRAGIEQLLILEKKTKNFAMIQYLEGRLRTLESEEVKK